MACAPDRGDGGFNDPYEAQNRRTHEFNVAIDRALVGPASGSVGAILPEPVRHGISNFADNLELPGQALNSLLQGRVEHMVQNTFRFVINSTLGVAGIFDPATSIGVAEAKTDFGETLHVWGAREGAYLELPLLGPSTERDLAGKVVDWVINPVGFILQPPESHYATGAKVLSRFGDRYRFSDTVDSLLYDSADGYAQARILYLQNRRFELGQEVEADAYDPYEDPYGN